MKPFYQLLTSLANGEDPDVTELLGKKRPNGPPTMQLLPSQQAVTDMHEGAGMANAQRIANSPRLDAGQPGAGLANPIGGVRGGSQSSGAKGVGMAALGGALQGIQNITQSSPMAPPPFTMGNGIRDNAIAQWSGNTSDLPSDWNGIAGAPLYKSPDDYRRAHSENSMPSFQYGGHLDPNQWGIVGDGSDPNSEEAIRSTPDGGVDIVPNPEQQGKSARVFGQPTPLSTPAKYVIAQTEQGNNQPITPSAARQPDNSTLVQNGISGWASDAPQVDDPNRPRTLDENYKALQDIYQQRIQHPSKWKNIGAAIVQSVDNSLNHKNQPIKTWDEITAERQSEPILRNIAIQNAIDKGKEDAADALATRTLKQKQGAWYDARPGLETAKQTGLTNRSIGRDLVNIFNHGNIDLTDPNNADFLAKGKELGITFPVKTPDTTTKFVPDEDTGQMYVVQSDKSGHTNINKALKDDGSPWVVKTKEMLTEEEKSDWRDLQRELGKNKNATTIKVADINAGSRKDVANINAGSRADVANINQGGQTRRANIHTAAQASQVMAAIRQSAPKGMAEQDIINKQQMYWNSLPEDVRKTLPSPIPPPQ